MPHYRAFLGGTCNDTTWRTDLISQLNIDYFNPVVEDWTEECQKIEQHEKEVKCQIHLYVITSEMSGVFSIAEAVDSAWRNDKLTFFQVCPSGFDESELKSLRAVGELITSHNGSFIESDSMSRLANAINYLESIVG